MLKRPNSTGTEERALLRRRYERSERVVEELLAVLEKDLVGTAEQARELGEDLGKLHGTRAFAGLPSGRCSIHEHLPAELNGRPGQAVV